ncbi:MAG: homoserine kinase [Psychromonas sp.]|nr:homoserine kinase [Psychromonas sp.]
MTIVAYAPASIGNVGVGFDLLGCALAPIDGSLFGDLIKISKSDHDFSLECTGRFANKLSRDIKENIVYHCYLAYQKELKKQNKEILAVKMILEKNLPVGSGLGSSSSSIVAAFEALNAWHDHLLDETIMLTMMGEMEELITGSIHFDNVSPCYLGGMQLIVNERDVLTQRIPHFKQWYWVIAYPGISISTADARNILPSQYCLSDVITYGRRLSTFIHASHADNSELAASVIKDVIAEPYRSKLLPGFKKAQIFAEQIDAIATGISGSGPTIFAVMTEINQAELLQNWLIEHFIQNDDGFCHICKLDDQGARVIGG